MLEKILLKYFNLKENWSETDWNISYDKLVDLIYDLGDLGVLLHTNANTIIDELDKIHGDDEERREW